MSGWKKQSWQSKPGRGDSAASSSAPPSRQSGWKGKNAQPPAEPPTKGKSWQGKGGGQDPHAAVTTSARARHWVKALVWTAAAVLLIAMLLVYLLYKPAQTPIVMMGATEYDHPMWPNSWALEDFSRYLPMHRRTLEIVNLPKDENIKGCFWSTQETGIKDFEFWVGEATKKVGSADSVIMYLSVHGLVNHEGKPCLVGPGVSPGDSTQWLPFERVLEAIKNADFREDLVKILVLDCSRMDESWPQGIVYNNFTDLLPDVLEAAKVPNLVVINSTSAGQTAWSAEELEGSVFGHFMALAVAGAPDLPEEGGNDDGKVQLSELQYYLQYHVRNWVEKHRADTQQPLVLLPDEVDEKFDPVVCYAVAAGLWSSRREQLDKIAGVYREKPDPNQPNNTPSQPKWTRPVADGEITELWRKHEALLAGSGAVGFNPMLLSEFENKLIWLEQLNVAGQRYKAKAKVVQSDLVSMLQQAEQGTLADTLPACSLALANKFGLDVPPPIDPRKRGQPKTEARRRGEAMVLAGEKWDEFKLQPFQEPNLLNELREAAGGGPELPLVETHYAVMLQNHLAPKLWNESGHLKAGPDETVLAALEARELAENAAAPDDIRAFYWVQPSIDQADRLRREAEDRIFVGEPDHLRIAKELLKAGDDSVLKRYRAANDRASEISAALRVRDQAWRDLPHLARWYSRRLPFTTNNESKIEALNQTINQRLIPLIDNAHNLSELLEQTPKTIGDLDNLKQTRKQVADSLTFLRGELDKHCQDLLDRRGFDQETLRQIIDVLEVPLCPSQQRANLRDKFDRGAERLFKDNPLTPAGQGSRAEEEEAFERNQRDVSRRLTQINRDWKVHPLFYLVEREDLDEPEGESEEEAPSTERIFRDHLRNITTKAASVREKLTEVFGTSKQAGEIEQLFTKSVDRRATASAGWELRQPASQADLLLRRLCSLAETAPERNPVLELRRIDLHNLLVWHALRVLDDFWGPAQPNSRELSFFERAGNAYLEAVQRLLAQRNREATAIAAEAAELLDQRRKAKLALQPRLDDVLILSNIGSQVVEQSTSIRIAENAPPGIGAMSVQDSLRKVIPRQLPNDSYWIDRQAIDFREFRDRTDPFGPLAYQYDSKDLRRHANQSLMRFNVICFFRGHLNNSQFSLRTSDGGVLVTFKQPEYSPPRIQVDYKGGLLKNRIMFVLDCSDSMDDRTKQRDGRTDTRLNVAKRELVNTLRNLETALNTEVGLCLFGHRLRYLADKQGRLVMKDGKPVIRKNEDLINNHPEITLPDSVQWPHQDIEIVHSISGFGVNQSRQMRALLESDDLKPWSLTPLYPSIRQIAREEYVGRGRERRTLVIITDGADNQWRSRTVDPNYTPVGRNDVLKLCQQRGIQVNIISFEMTKQSDQEAKEAFKELATETRGTYFDATNAALLADSLEKIVGGENIYNLLPDVAQPEVEESNQIGNQTELPEYDQHSGRYIVEVPQRGSKPLRTKVHFIGGEDHKIEIADSELQHVRWVDSGTKQSIPLSDPLNSHGPNERYQVFAHLPHWEGGTLHFEVSLQNANEYAFSPTPVEYWIEIVPRFSNGKTDDPIIFYDPQFKDRRRAPIAVCKVHEWPEAALEAEIHAWWRFKEATTPHTASINEIIQSGRPIPGTDLVFRAEVQRDPNEPDWLQLALTHNKGDAFAVKPVSVLPPKQINRRFDPEQGISMHEFRYKGLTEPELLKTQIRFIERKAIKQGAIHPEDPIVIRIPSRIRTVQ